jgi:hypothetical protein
MEQTNISFMKTIQLFLFITAATILCSFSRCKKDDDPQLPPETTTGANTFGCKVNGKVFVPRDGNGRPGLFCQYVYLGNGPGGGWSLNIPAYNYSTERGVSIVTDSLFLEENKVYEFKTTKGNAKAFYRVNINRGVDVFPKIDNESGQLFVTKHDLTNRILSGTFSFIGTNGTGEQVNITEGRFDIRY